MRLLPALVLVAIAAAGCSSPADNRLLNPGFEEGETGWSWLDWSSSWQGPFEVDSAAAVEGSRSLRMHLTPDANLTIAIRGAVQEIRRQDVGDFPEKLSGSYRVDKWSPGTNKTYVQAVIGLAPEDPERPVCERAGTSPCQLAWVLGGIEEPPFNLTNRRFLFVDRSEPVVGEWVRFEVNPRADFEREWGQVPRDYDRLILYLEVRYEYPSGLPKADRPPVEAEVRWDDLYLG